MKTTHPIIIGIHRHKASHVAVAIDTQGTRLAALSIPTNPKGYLELERWSRSFGEVLAFGIEGTGSYGAGLSRSLLAQGHNVVEVTRPNWQLRYTLDLSRNDAAPLIAFTATKETNYGHRKIG
jgi:transposase